MRRGLSSEHRNSQRAEEAELQRLREAAAIEEAVALALSAFAVQAYLKSVLCPSLADFTPRANLHRSRVRFHIPLSPAAQAF